MQLEKIRFIYQTIRNGFAHALLWIKPIFWRKVDKTESTSLAGIHATMLAILMTGLSAYVIFVFTKIQEMEMRALSEAEKINDLRPVGSLYGITNQEEVFDRDKLIMILSDMLTCRNLPSVPRDREYSAEKALGIMQALTSQYPFPEKIFKTKDGHFAVRSEPEPLLFGNIKDVREWVNSINKVSINLISFWEDNTGCLPALLEKYSKSKGVVAFKKSIVNGPLTKRMLSEEGVPLYLRPEYLEPMITYRAFFDTLITARRIMKKTQYYLKQADVFKNRYPSINILATAYFMICLSFVFGVIIPISFQSARSIFVIFIPFLFYFIVFIYLAFRLSGYILNIG